MSTNLTHKFEEMSKSQGSGSLQRLYSWTYGDHTIQCYGWCVGEAGFENTTELPPGGFALFLDTDSSVQILFGDIFICKCGSTPTPTDIDIAEYSEFYTQACGGFDECDTDSDSDAESASEDESFVVGHHEVVSDVVSEEDCFEDEDEDISSDEDAELDEDDHDY